MALLCAVAYGFGHVLRYSIAHSAAPAADQSEHILEHVSSWALGIAYIISVAYYLNLFGEFALSLFDTRLRSTVQSAGLSVSAFNDEIKTANEIVIENCL